MSMSSGCALPLANGKGGWLLEDQDGPAGRTAVHLVRHAAARDRSVLSGVPAIGVAADGMRHVFLYLVAGLPL